MTEPVILATRRWDNGDGKPSSHSCREVLEVALAKIDAGEIAPDHIIICYGSVKETVNDGGFLQGGKFDSYAQFGLLHSTMKLMQGD